MQHQKSKLRILWNGLTSIKGINGIRGTGGNRCNGWEEIRLSYELWIMFEDSPGTLWTPRSHINCPQKCPKSQTITQLTHTKRRGFLISLQARHAFPGKVLSWRARGGVEWRHWGYFQWRGAAMACCRACGEFRQTPPLDGDNPHSCFGFRTLWKDIEEKQFVRGNRRVPLILYSFSARDESMCVHDFI